MYTHSFIPLSSKCHCLDPTVLDRSPIFAPRVQEIDINSRRVPLDFHFATVSPCVLWKRAEQKVSVLFLRQTGPKCPYLLELVLATLFHVNKQ